MRVEGVVNSHLHKITSGQRREIYDTIHAYLHDNNITTEQVKAVTQLNLDSTNDRKIGLVIRT